MVRGKPISRDVRDIIIENHKKNKSAYKIANELNLTRASVQNIINLFKSSGNVKTKHKSGRPSIASSQDMRALRRIVKKNRRERASAITVEWRNVIKKDVSVDTCRRNIKKLGYGFYKAKKKPFLTKLQRKKRLSFAKDHLNWTPRQWNTVIWSDESRFEICVGDDRNKVIRKQDEAFNEDCLQRTVKFPASVMVWGCMSAKGVGQLAFINGSVTAIKYQEILHEYLLPSIPALRSSEGEFIFQQDGAPCHTAASSKNWLRTNDVPTMTWPSNSPDLSPIENLWGRIKKRLKSDPATTVQELRDKIAEIWNGITRESCEELVKTMPLRMKEVVKRKGGVTRW